MFWMVLQQTLVSEKSADQVLRRICAVDTDDELFGSPRRHLILDRADRRRFTELHHRIEIDRDRVCANPDEPAAVQHGALRFGNPQAHQLVATAQEVVHVKTGLQPDDVVREETFEDRLPHRGREHFEVPWFGPRHVDEVLQHRIRQRGTY